MKVLVVDDDKNIVSMIRDFLAIHNMETLPGYCGKDAIVLSDDPDIKMIILDVNMDDMNGFEACKIIREKTNVPILFLTAKTAQSDKILGLGIGADDYMTKPFDPLELVARVKSHVRRYETYTSNAFKKDTIIIKDLVIEKNTHTVKVSGESVDLSSTEYALLIYLISNPNRILSRSELLNNVWHSDIYTENTVNTYIMRLRDKIEKDKDEPRYLITIRGEGYVFKN